MTTGMQPLHNVTEMVDTLDDEIKILATKIHSVNAINQDHFAYSTQLDVRPMLGQFKDLNGQKQWKKK